LPPPPPPTPSFLPRTVEVDYIPSLHLPRHSSSLSPRLQLVTSSPAPQTCIVSQTPSPPTTCCPAAPSFTARRTRISNSAIPIGGHLSPTSLSLTAFSLETPLQLAVAHSAISGARQCKVLQFLLQARADVNAVDDRPVCLMLTRCKRFTHTLRSRSTPLHAACVADDAETALLLLNAKADVVARNSRYLEIFFFTPLLRALFSTAQQVSLRRRLNSGHTPLHVAACQGSVTAAQCVLTAGADINAAAGRCITRIACISSASLTARTETNSLRCTLRW
jgi:hypothetical protein